MPQFTDHANPKLERRNHPRIGDTAPHGSSAPTIHLGRGGRRLRTFLQADWPLNRGNQKALLVIGAYRVGNGLYCLRKRTPLAAPLYCAFRAAYTLLTEWFLGVEIKLWTQIGPGLKLQHCMGLVINANTIVGAGCTFRQNTTIGEKYNREGILASPILGDGVDVGANAVIIGGVRIGNNVTIGAGSVVTHDIPDDAVVAGNPMRILSS